MPVLRHGRITVIALLSAVMVASCSSRGPDNPPELVDGYHSVYQTQRDVAVSRERLLEWLPTIELQDFLTGSGSMPPVTGTEPVRGEWPDTGAVRRVYLGDGNSLLERMISNHRPEGFRYQIWDFTGAAQFAITYATGEFEYIELGPDSTRIVWTYSMRPRSWLTRPISDRFIANEFAPFMEAGLDVITEQAALQLGPETQS